MSFSSLLAFELLPTRERGRRMNLRPTVSTVTAEREALTHRDHVNASHTLVGLQPQFTNKPRQALSTHEL